MKHRVACYIIYFDEKKTNKQKTHLETQMPEKVTTEIPVQTKSYKSMKSICIRLHCRPHDLTSAFIVSNISICNYSFVRM